MAGTFSSKKVARAARTGGGRRRTTNSSYGWYAMLAAICIIGVSIVIFSRNERLSASSPGDTAPLAATSSRSGDHWFEAFGVYTCDKFAPNVTPKNDPYGITTSNDGVISIAPIKKGYAGHNANLGLFAKGAGVKLSRASIQLPGDSTKFEAGAKCGGKDGEFVVKEWSNAKDDKTGKVTAVNPTALLLKNNAAVVIAYVPKGDRNIPLPPSAATLDQVAAKALAASSSSAPAPAPGATPPAAPASAPASTPATEPAKK